MLIDRKKFKWNVTLQAGNTGEIVETTFESYWSPAFDGIADEVAAAAAAKAWYASCPHDAQQRVPHAPISAALVEDE